MRRLRWVGLAAVPSSLMLGLTTYISTDISPIPLLWIIPLTLYLLSFVVVFLRWPVPWVGVGRNPRGMTPHKAMIVIQLVAIPVQMLVLMIGGGFYVPDIQTTWLRWTMFCVVFYLPYFLTALVCHGELARDRPPPKLLTEFFLWMSVGGMVGGFFNAMIAPLVPWWGLFEFPLALVFAAMVRPQGKGSSWTDRLFEGMPKEQARGLSYLLDIGLGVLLLAFSWFLIRNSATADGLLSWQWLHPSRVDLTTKYNPLFRLLYKGFGVEVNSAYKWTRSLALLLTFGVPIGLALLTWKRSFRLALCLGAVILANALYQEEADTKTLYRDRSYFGILHVLEETRNYAQKADDDPGRLATQYTYLMHGTTYHGLNYQFPDGTKGSPDMRRLATTYYHRECPVGIAMERLNWFPGYKTDTDDKRMTYWADAPPGRAGRQLRPRTGHVPAAGIDRKQLVGAALCHHRPGHGHDGVLRPALPARHVLRN